MNKYALIFVSLLISSSAFAQSSCNNLFAVLPRFISQGTDVVIRENGGVLTGTVFNYGHSAVTYRPSVTYPVVEGPKGPLPSSAPENVPVARYVQPSFISMNFAIKNGSLTVLNFGGRFAHYSQFTGYFRPMLNAVIAEYPGLRSVVVKIQGADAKKFLLKKQEGLSDAEALALDATYSQLASMGFAQIRQVEVLSVRVREKDSEGKWLPQPEVQDFIQLTVSR